MHGVIGRPHPTLIVVGTVHLYQGTMLGGNGIQIAITIFLALFLIAVEVGPGALHLLQFLLRGEVAGFPVASQFLVPHKGALLALSQSVHHLDDVLAEDVFLGGILTTGEGKSHSRHVVSGTVSLEFGGGRVPAVSLRIALCGEAIGVAVVIELLLHRQADQLVDVEITVPGQAVVAIDAHLIEWQRLSHGDIRRYGVHTVCDLYLCRDGVSVWSTIVTQNHSAYLIYSTYGIDGGVGFGSLCGFRCVEPFHLAVLSLAVGIVHPQLIGQSRGVAHGHLHTHSFHMFNGAVVLSCRASEKTCGQQAD